MTKKSIVFVTILGSAVLLSACNPSLPSKTPTDQDTDNLKMESQANPESTVGTPTPTLTKDDSLDSIEADLKNTSIKEEDFSDIQ